MAGGPGTPTLAAAVSNSGGLGVVAGVTRRLRTLKILALVTAASEAEAAAAVAAGADGP